MAAAATPKKITRKELLKTPDEFLTLSEKVYLFIREHTKQFTIGGIAIVAVAIVVFGTIWYLGYSENKAVAAYNEASAPLYSSGEISLDKADATAGALEKFIQDFGSTQPARYALLDLGGLYVRLEKYDKSIDAYKKFLNSITPVEESLRPFVQDSLAHVYEAKKDYDSAAKAWDEVLKLQDTTLKEQAYMGLIRVRVAAGDIEGARKAYEGLEKEFPGSISSQMAQAKLDTLSE
jgi:predicted negative regulator of RcsB-dependent stress response